MAKDRLNIDFDNNQEEIISKKLYTDSYNINELVKSVDVRVDELIGGLPDVDLDLVPRPIYDAEVELNAELVRQVDELNKLIEDLTQRLIQKTTDSGSLYVDNDGLLVQNAKLENQLESNNNILSQLRTELSTAIQKAISENAERTALEAEIAGLNAQKTALLKQVDVLNNLVASAQMAVTQTQEAFSSFTQEQSKPTAKVAGNVAVITGENQFLTWNGALKNKIQKRTEDFQVRRNKPGIGGGPGAINEFVKGYKQYKVTAGSRDMKVTISGSAGPVDSRWNISKLFQGLSATIPAGQSVTFNIRDRISDDGLDNSSWRKGKDDGYPFNVVFTCNTLDNSEVATATFTAFIYND